MLSSSDSSHESEHSTTFEGSFSQPCTAAFASASRNAISIANSLPVAHAASLITCITRRTRGEMELRCPGTYILRCKRHFVPSRAECSVNAQDIAQLLRPAPCAHNRCRTNPTVRRFPISHVRRTTASSDHGEAYDRSIVSSLWRSSPYERHDEQQAQQ